MKATGSATTSARTTLPPCAAMAALGALVTGRVVRACRRDPSRGVRSEKVALRDDDDVARWIRSYWDEEDVTFYWEVADDGWVTRHVELVGAELIPRAAASLDEWMRELEAGRIQEYQGRYGCLADQPVTEWDPDFPHEALTREQYETVWVTARRFLEQGR